MNRLMFSILAALNGCEGPLSSQEITMRLSGQGIDLSERIVRHYSRKLSEMGYITSPSKRGGIITDRGRQELNQRFMPEPTQTETLITHLIQKKTALHDGYWSVLKEL